jgi:nicotinamide riboside kinase
MPLRIAVLGAHPTGTTALVLDLQKSQEIDGTAPSFVVEEAEPLPHQHRYDLTLLLGLDLPIVALTPGDTETAQQQARLDAQLRQTLDTHGVPYAVVYGHGPAARTVSALQAIEHHISSHDAANRRRPRAGGPVWQWCCDSCSDAACEHLLFSELVKRPLVRA